VNLAGVRAVHSHVQTALVDGAGRPVSAWSACLLELDAGSSGDDRMLAEMGQSIGTFLTRHALNALGVAPSQVRSYGKGAIVGAARSLEQAAAILHPLMGKAMRATLGAGKAIVPSTVKIGAPGAHLDVPLHGLDNEWDFPLISAVEVIVPGAPTCDEIAVVVALGTDPRSELAA
jgi:Amino acid synthesis